LQSAAEIYPSPFLEIRKSLYRAQGISPQATPLNSQEGTKKAEVEEYLQT
jgi:hypothetical protein